MHQLKNLPINLSQNTDIKGENSSVNKRNERDERFSQFMDKQSRDENTLADRNTAQKNKPSHVSDANDKAASHRATTSKNGKVTAESANTKNNTVNKSEKNIEKDAVNSDKKTNDKNTSDDAMADNSVKNDNQNNKAEPVINKENQDKKVDDSDKEDESQQLMSFLFAADKTLLKESALSAKQADSLATKESSEATLTEAQMKQKLAQLGVIKASSVMSEATSERSSENTQQFNNKAIDAAASDLSQLTEKSDGNSTENNDAEMTQGVKSEAEKAGDKVLSKDERPIVKINSKNENSVSLPHIELLKKMRESGMPLTAEQKATLDDIKNKDKNVALDTLTNTSSGSGNSDETTESEQLISAKNAAPNLVGNLVDGSVDNSVNNSVNNSVDNSANNSVDKTVSNSFENVKNSTINTESGDNKVAINGQLVTAENSESTDKAALIEMLKDDQLTNAKINNEVNGTFQEKQSAISVQQALSRTAALTDAQKTDAQLAKLQATTATENTEQSKNSDDQEMVTDEIATLAKADESLPKTANVQGANQKVDGVTNNTLNSAFTDIVGQATEAVDSSYTQKSAEALSHGVVGDVAQIQKNNVALQQETISMFRKDFTDAVKDKVMIMVSQKLQQFDIRLDPAELGSMQVRLNLQHDQAQVNFVVQNQQAKEALEQNMDKLKSMLAEQGVDVGNASVEQQANQSSDTEQQSGDSGHSNSNGFSDDELAQAEMIVQSNLINKATSGVDYYA